MAAGGCDRAERILCNINIKKSNGQGSDVKNGPAVKYMWKSTFHAAMEFGISWRNYVIICDFTGVACIYSWHCCQNPADIRPLLATPPVIFFGGAVAFRRNYGSELTDRIIAFKRKMYLLIVHLVYLPDDCIYVWP